MLEDSTRRRIKAAACRAPQATFVYPTSFRKHVPGGSIQRAASQTAHNAQRATTRIWERHCVQCALQDHTVLESVTRNPAFHCRVRLAFFQRQEQVCVRPVRRGRIQGKTQALVPRVLKACSADLVWGLCLVLQEHFVSPIAPLATLALLDPLQTKKVRLLAFHARKGRSVEIQDR